MALTNPAVPPRFEQDLMRGHTVVRYADDNGSEGVLLPAWLEYRPFVVGRGADGQYLAVPLQRVCSVEVNDETSHWDPSRCEMLVVAHWRRAPWGELVRFIPQ